MLINKVQNNLQKYLENWISICNIIANVHEQVPVVLQYNMQ